MKHILLAGAGLIVLLSVVYFGIHPKPPTTISKIDDSGMVQPTPDTPSPDRVGRPGTQTNPTDGKIKAANFSGILEEVNTGCFSDGECYVVVDGKHITVLMGWSQEVVGSIIGVPSIGDLETFIGKRIEVYAKDNLDGTYTLYGSAGFYVKVLSDTGSTTPPTKLPVPGKLKSANFSGVLESFKTGCYYDAECYVVVGGKHVTVLTGERISPTGEPEEVGSIIGVPSIGDLQPVIGSMVSVYAKDNQDGTYTLYGSKGFYVKVLRPGDTSTQTNTCVVSGCSSQLCVDPSDDPGVTTCMFNPQYACYKSAECTRQTTGKCGWTDTPELQACLDTNAGRQ